MSAVMLDVAGYELDSEDKEILQHPLVGGVILFSRNYHDVTQLQHLVQQIRQAARHPVVIAVDQEGGRVQRFRDGFTSLPAMQSFAALYPSQQAKTFAQQAGWLMASELLAVGIDLSFAPVLDVGHTSKAIGDRAFHHEATQVLLFAQAFIAGMHRAGMAATGKHFPGHGAVQADSHLETPRDGRDKETLFNQDMWVFQQLIAQRQLDAVMPAHIIYSQCDPLPASASPYWLKQILQQQLGFDGIIFSDDLSMEGAAMLGSYSQRAEMALDAGCDVVLVCNQRQGAIEILDQLKRENHQEILKLQAKNSQQKQGLKDSAEWQQAYQQMTQIAQDWQNYKAKV